MVYSNPWPSPPEMQEFYPDDYYHGRKSFLSMGYEWLQKFFLRLRIAKIERFKKSGCILDIGCGDGSFLAGLDKRRWQAFGVEFSESARREINGKKRDFEFIVDKFLDHNFGRDFAVITLWGVLEHLDRPLETLSKIKSILQDDGLLFISLPNIASWEARVFGAAWFHLDPPRHLFHYSPQTVKALLAKSGFTIMAIDHIYLEWSFFGTFQSWCNALKCQYNFLYNWIKRSKIIGLSYPFKLLYTLLLTLFLTPVMLPLSSLLILLESLFRNGPIINVYAVKHPALNGIARVLS